MEIHSARPVAEKEFAIMEESMLAECTAVNSQAAAPAAAPTTHRD